MNYTPSSWYWLVGNKTGEVFSSALPGYIATSDSTYQAWLAAGNNPSKILSDGELADVLVKASVPNSVVAAAGVSSFGNLTSNDMRGVILKLGVALSSTGTPALDAIYEVDGPEWEDMKNEAQYISTYSSFSGGLSTLVWKARSTNVTFSTTAQFLAVVKGLADYLSKWKTYLSLGGTEPTIGSATIA